MSIELRDIQRDAIKQILTAIKNGKTDILVSAPTGTGKSLIALELAKILHKNNSDHRSYILTSEKVLQYQYEKDCIGKFAKRGHSEVISLCGIDTYKCNLNNEPFSLGLCKTSSLSNRAALNLPCSLNCEYLQRWIKAQCRPTVVFNFSYYLIQMNYVLKQFAELAPFQPRPFVIIDEAHTLANNLENHFACRVNLKIVDWMLTVQQRLLQGGYSNSFTNYVPTKFRNSLVNCLKAKINNNEECFNALVDVYDHLFNIRDIITKFKEELSDKFSLKKHKDSSTFVSSANKLSKSTPGYIKGFYKFADSIKDYTCKIEDYVEIVQKHGLKDLVVDEEDGERVYHNLSDELLFYNHFAPFSNVRIYMSATLQPKLMIQRFNLNPNTTEIITLNSGWEPNKSPVLLLNTANFKYCNIKESTKTAIKKIDEILKKHKDERGLVHTTSFSLLNDVIKGSKYPKRFVTYSNTAEKQKLLNDIMDYPDDTILIGPSLSQGVDLYDSMCRFNIVIKMSYPNVSSNLWKKRFEIQKHVYFGEAANILEQSSGRSTRHSDDTSITYVLDSRARDFVLNSQEYFSYEFIKRVESGVEKLHTSWI